MAITYTYRIIKTITYPTYNNLTDVIKEIEYEYTGVEGTGENRKEAVINRTCVLNDPDPENFTAFADLTEANVREFVKQTVNVDHNKSMIGQMLAEKALPEKENKPLPWA